MNEPTLEIIREFVQDTYLSGEKGLGEAEDLFELGVLDSLAFLNLISFLEERFSLRFGSEALQVDHFRTLDAIAGMVVQARREIGDA